MSGSARVSDKISKAARELMEEYMDMGLVTFDQWEGDTQEPRSPSAPRSDGERVFEEKGRDAIAIFLKKLSNLNIEVLKNKASEALAVMETRYLQRELRQLLCDGGGDDDVEELFLSFFGEANNTTLANMIVDQLVSRSANSLPQLALSKLIIEKAIYKLGPTGEPEEWIKRLEGALAPILRLSDDPAVVGAGLSGGGKKKSKRRKSKRRKSKKKRSRKK